ncbi:MAG: LysR family transcriptional regulator [Phreatobacter sp.]|jgi:DNA-binding transcriptional LysR family regulator|uniref:LysR family transcriptional regulator n=1 Tax=Phreatobacter sp. TaxID=1966341 RepID=UPI004035A569
MMNADDLVLFDAIVASGGVSAAARRLGLPKTTVSRRLVRLEATLGIALFDRTGRKLRLTRAGETLRAPAMAAGLALAEAHALALAERGTPQGVLRIVSPFLFGRLILSPYLGRFLAANQEVTAIVRFDNAPLDPLRENVDVAIRIAEPTEPYLISSRLAEAELKLYAPASFALGIARPADLTPLRLIQVANQHSPEVVLRLTGRGATHEIRVRVGVTVNDPEAACTMAAGGGGFAVLPSFLAEDFVRKGALVPVLPGLVAGQVAIFALLPPGRNAIPIVAHFLKGLRRQLADQRFGKSPTP